MSNHTESLPYIKYKAAFIWPGDKKSRELYTRYPDKKVLAFNTLDIKGYASTDKYVSAGFQKARLLKGSKVEIDSQVQFIYYWGQE